MHTKSSYDKTLYIYTWRCKVAIKMHHQMDHKYNTYMSFQIMHVVKLEKSWRMTNLLRNEKKKWFVEDTYWMHHHFFPVEKFLASKTTSSFKTAHSFVLSFFFFSISPSRIIIILSFLFLACCSPLFLLLLLLLLSLSLSLSPIYLFNQSFLLLLLSKNDQVAHHKTKFV
jgi:hypothetical protein